MDQAMIDKLKVLDKASQEKNAQALAEQRAKDGHVALKCPKCGVESVVAADSKKAKCGSMTGPVKDGIQAACGAALIA